MSSLKVLTASIVAFKMASICQRVECKAEVVANVGCQGLCPNITIVVLIYAFHGLGLRLHKGGNVQKDKHYMTVK